MWMKFVWSVVVKFLYEGSFLRVELSAIMNSYFIFLCIRTQSSLIVLEAEAFIWEARPTATTTNPEAEVETTTDNGYQVGEKEYSHGYNKESSTNENSDRSPYGKEPSPSLDNDRKEPTGYNEAGEDPNKNFQIGIGRHGSDYSPTKRTFEYGIPKSPTYGRNSHIGKCPANCVPRPSTFEGSGEGFATSNQLLSHLPQLMNDGDIVSSGYQRPGSSEHERQPTYDQQRGNIENDYTNNLSGNRRGEKKSCPCPCVCPPSNCREERKDERDDLDSRFHQNRPQLPEPLTDLPTLSQLIAEVATPKPEEPEPVPETEPPLPTGEPVESSTPSNEAGEETLTTEAAIDENPENAAQSAAAAKQLSKPAVAAIWICGILSVILVAVGLIALRAFFIKRAMSKKREVPEKPDSSNCYYQPYYM